MKVIALTAALAVLATPAFAGDHKAQIQGSADAWMAAYNAGDAAGVAKFYLDDARFSTAMGTVEGRPAIEQYLKAEMASGVKFQNITVDKAERFGDVNYSQGTFTATGPQGPATGHWLIVGKCSGETCTIQNHTANLALPTAAPASAGAMVQPMNAGDIKWGPVPPNIPAGAQLAVIAGDPSKEGQPYTVRLKMPANYKVPAHYHPADEAATVISGVFNLGMGDKLDTSKGLALQPGGFAYAPAGMHHYGWTTEETVVQINGNGPFAITYVNPEDDPSKTAAK
jgi:ketosteroid isomerase-like protein/quercetin dioxygenase-like cupin family protein